MSSLPNPDARFAFITIPLSTLLDQRGTDLIFFARASRRSDVIKGLQWEIAHGQNHQWETHLIQVKTFQKDSEDHGRFLGLALPLPDPLSKYYKDRLTPHMIQVAREHFAKYPYVNCLLFISAANSPEERAKARDRIWQETIAMICAREQLLSGHCFSGDPDPSPQP